MKFSYQARKWFVGLLNAALGSMATALTMAVVDPKDFNPFDQGSWTKVGSIAIASMLVNVALYFRNHPIPDPEKDTDAPRASALIQAAAIANTDPGMSEQIKRGVKQVEAAERAKGQS